MARERQTAYYIVDLLAELTDVIENVKDDTGEDYFDSVYSTYHDITARAATANKPVVQFILPSVNTVSGMVQEDFTTYNILIVVYFFSNDFSAVLEEGIRHLSKIDDALSQYCISDDDTHGMTTLSKTGVILDNVFHILGYENETGELKLPYKAMALQYEARINSSSLSTYRIVETEE